jgi:hypothetical protein
MMGISYNTSISTNGLILHIDPANVKSYPGSGTDITDLSKNLDFTTYNSGTYFNHNSANGTFEITRSTTAGSKAGGGFEATASSSSDLAVDNFLYNDHTISLWCKINDIARFLDYDATETTEGNSALLVWRGYHAGFYYNSSNLYYVIWTNGSTVSISTSSISEGAWLNIIGRRSSNTLELIINNTSVAGPTSVTTTTTNVNTTDNIRIGYANAGTSNYAWYSDLDIGDVKLYNRALSDDEINKNFEALRGRFGI